MTPAEMLDMLNFLAPALASVSTPDKMKALELAAAYRPSCLPEAKQDNAQIFYAAWILSGRLASSGGIRPYGVISEKEGDLSRTYGNTAGADDPLGFYGQWFKLNTICKRMGAITVGKGVGHGCCADYADN